MISLDTIARGISFPVCVLSCDLWSMGVGLFILCAYLDFCPSVHLYSCLHMSHARSRQSMIGDVAQR